MTTVVARSVLQQCMTAKLMVRPKDEQSDAEYVQVYIMINLFSVLCYTSLLKTPYCSIALTSTLFNLTRLGSRFFSLFFTELHSYVCIHM